MKIFQSPSSILVVGPSSCGKTTFVSSLLKGDNPRKFFRKWIPNIHYCYGAEQPGFATLKKTIRNITFHQGIPSVADLTKWFKKTGGGLLIMDDLMKEGGSDSQVLDLFTRESHHRNITVMYLCQDMFPPGKYAKTISRNAHYIVAFKNPRDQLGFRNLVQQAFPQNWRDVVKVYKRATNRPYGYLILDFHPSSNDKYRLYANILSEGGSLPRVFCPKDHAEG